MKDLCCPCCENHLRPGLVSWHQCCSVCRYEASHFVPTLTDVAALAAIDEPRRELALRELRSANFETVIGMIRAAVLSRDARLLDVGCAHGWFLEAAAAHFRVLGLEPDTVVGGAARDRGLPVRIGFFPAALADDECFDVIVFNDVFEHLTDLPAALSACRRHLVSGGRLVINLPNVQGLFYRFSKLLLRFGVRGPFSRMWQEGLPSPHLHFFSAESLRALLAHHGFVFVQAAELPAVTLNGLWQRVRYTRDTHPLRSALMFAGALVLIPLGRVFASDAMVLLFRRSP
jgi:SAM-dependent methyltransferase